MTLSGGVLTLAIALLAAQGPQTSTARHKGKGKESSRQPAPTRTTKRVTPTPPPHVAPTPRRDDTGAGASPSAREDLSRQGEVPPAEPEGGGTPAAGATRTAKPTKTKVYTFGAMDVEGKLKTPQLLYFLNRVKLELEMSAPDHRSFMKELERTAEDPNL